MAFALRSLLEKKKVTRVFCASAYKIIRFQKCEKMVFEAGSHVLAFFT